MACYFIRMACAKSVEVKRRTILGFFLGCFLMYMLMSSKLHPTNLYNTSTDETQKTSAEKITLNYTEDSKLGLTNMKHRSLVTNTGQNKRLEGNTAITKFTLKEFKQRARSDTTLFSKIMGQKYLLADTKAVLKRYFLGYPYSFKFNTTLQTLLQSNFNMESDMIVFLHIQKTGGMHMNKRFDRELQIPFQCKRTCKIRPCNCLNPSNNMWFYNAAYSGWQCGLHADWTQMHKCIPGLADKIEQKKRQRRYFYFTQLRDGLERYLSEYHHQTATNHWQSAILGCGKTINANKRDVKPCFHGSNWKGVTLDNFMACKDNLATHRMTRMLADLLLSGCYSNFTDESAIKKRAPVWLESAKNNLQTMEYFGLMEDEPASDKLFYKTYNLTFRRFLSPAKPKPSGSLVKMTEEQFLNVLRLAELDIHLYLFGRDLFYKRLRETIPN